MIVGAGGVFHEKLKVAEGGSGGSLLLRVFRGFKHEQNFFKVMESTS